MEREVYPREEEYEAALKKRGQRWQIPAVVEELKAKEAAITASREALAANEGDKESTRAALRAGGGTQRTQPTR